ncbi:hypothetical protein P9107_12475, partial [Gallibacterium anatis]
MSEFELIKRTPFLKEIMFKEREWYSQKEIDEDIYSLSYPEYFSANQEKINGFYKRLSWRQSSMNQEFVQLKYSAGINMDEVVA